MVSHPGKSFCDLTTIPPPAANPSMAPYARIGHVDKNGVQGPLASAEERWGRLGRLVCHLLPPHPTSLWGLQRQK